MWCTCMCTMHCGASSNVNYTAMSLLLFRCSPRAITYQTSTRLDTFVLLNDVLVLCVKCNREMKAHSYEGHECTSCLTASDERTVEGILKRAVSTSPDKSIIKLATGGAV